MNSQARCSIILVVGITYFACASNSESATVYFRIDQSVPGEFQLFAHASHGDNFGIARYSIPLVGPITAIDHISPNTDFANSATGSGPAGFTALRAIDGNTLVSAAQDFTVANGIVIRGFGQQDSSFAEMGITPVAPAEQADWGVPLLIARGMATGPVRIDTSIDFGAGVITTVGGPPTTVAALAIVIPEPASILLVAVGCAGLGITGSRWPARRYCERL